MIQTKEEAFWYLPENLSEGQKSMLASFRSALTQRNVLLANYDSDPTLLRFLKARQWHLEPAVAMYSHMAKWRQDNQVEELYATYDFPELDQLLPHYPHFYHKQDKYGRPVYIELLGGLDCGAMLKAAPLERIMKYHIWTWERMERQLLPACSRLVGHPVITATVIIDLAGLSLRNFTLTAQRLLSTIAKIDQDYYPEHLGTMFIINTSWFFTTIWAVVYPLLEERTRKKIIVLGSNYQDKLKELIPEENLPTFFGGLSPCPDKQSSQGLWSREEPCTSSSWLPVGHTAQDPPHTQPAAKGCTKEAMICPEGADALPCDEDSIPVGVACAALEGLEGLEGPLPAKQLPQAKVDAVAV